MLDKSLLGYLSIKYEVGEDANPATVSQDPNDAGGWSYGLYQLASNEGSVQDFVAWLRKQAAPFNEYGEQLAAAGDPACDQGFVDKWVSIGSIDPGGFGKLQDSFAKEVYFDVGAAILLTSDHFDVSQRSFVLQQVLMSNCVQHGPKYGAEALVDGASSIGRDLNDMNDHDIIYYTYEIKLTDPSWSSGSPNDRPGLYARWQNERAEALAMLGGNSG